MNQTTLKQKPAAKAPRQTKASAANKTRVQLKEHIVEIISDSGEGAQKCGQSLGAIAAQMGNGIWTTEIIPAEIRPAVAKIEAALGRIRPSIQNPISTSATALPTAK